LITPLNNGDTHLKVWFSPNTKQKSKPSKNPATPVDMQEVFNRISQAKESVLFLLFNPGTPSIVDKIKEAAAKRPKTKPLFVRGAISDAATAAKAATNIFSTDILKKPDTYYEARITGVAAIPGPFSYFEQELLKIGFATIHDKIVVIDPFGTNPTVITGSHNLGFAASYKNDENMIILEDKNIAAAYTAHVLDVVNHFKWRYKLQRKVIDAKAKTLEEKKKVLKKDWNDLNELDTWMDYYFNSQGFINRDKFILK
jgi:phosphatidylserine/phosphatidylglycerophosphate/cardiolipin synthase-like enzyme